MRFDYLDLSAFIEHVTERASNEGIKVTTIQELYDYLEDNPTADIHIIERN